MLRHFLIFRVDNLEFTGYVIVYGGFPLSIQTTSSVSPPYLGNYIKF